MLQLVANIVPVPKVTNNALRHRNQRDDRPFRVLPVILRVLSLDLLLIPGTEPRPVEHGSYRTTLLESSNIFAQFNVNTERNANMASLQY